MTLDALPPGWHYVAAGLLLGVLPVVAARAGAKIPLAELGLGLGRWREGLVWLAVGMPLAVVAGRIAATQQAMQAVYPLSLTAGSSVPAFAGYAILAFLYYGGWEVLFRGVLLLGLGRSIGHGSANAVQTAMSTLAHFGRALNETFAALPAGFVFGMITKRLNSVWYLAAIHWTVGMSMEWFMHHPAA